MSITPFLKDVELEAICGTPRNRETMIELKNKYGIKSVLYSYDELLNTDLDAIYIGLPNNLHFEFAKKSIRGKLFMTVLLQ